MGGVEGGKIAVRYIIFSIKGKMKLIKRKKGKK